MNGTRKSIIVACFAACCASVGVLSGTVTPVAYGVGEATTGVTATGIVSTITALISAGGGLWALLLKTAGSNSILDAVELLRPVLTGKTSLPEGAVRVALTVLEADAVRRGSAKDYDDVKALSKQFLFPPKSAEVVP